MRSKTIGCLTQKKGGLNSRVVWWV